jgi:NodT family efflux transporter outer membrane factor (OMF) lipoprotein
MIGQLFEKQVDSVLPVEALFLRRPENSDPPGGQEAVSSADAEHHAAPRFFEGS